MTIYTCKIKILSVFLAILLLMMAIPLSVFALDGGEERGELEDNDDSASSFVGLLDEAFEEVSLREESVKHFRLADGSYVAVQYDGAVHTMDIEGKWQDIDNRLSEKSGELVTSDARIKFVKKITGNREIFTLHEGNRKLTVSLDGAIKKTKGEAFNTESAFDESATLLQKLTTLDNLSSSVIYRDILEGVDLEYIVNGRNIKENLIVKTQNGGNAFSFTVKLNNMSAVLSDTGDVWLCDGEDVLYTIPAPTAWDADGVCADRVYYTLESVGNGCYRLTVTVDEAWMKADGRAYPVTVDPPIYADTASDTMDTYISAASASQSYGSGTTVRVGEDQNGKTMIGLFKMTDLPTLPAAATVISSELSLYCTDYAAYTTGGLNIGLYEALGTWNNSSTWSGLTAYQSVPSTSLMIDCAYLDAYSENGFVSWDITELVSKWYSDTANGTSSNNGVYLRDVNGVNNAAVFASREASTNRPVYKISYRVINGIEEYYGYRTQSAGLAGTGYVNLATGQLTFAFSGYGTDDGLMPYTPVLVYNSLQKNAYFDATSSGTAVGAVGYGWKLDAHQMIAVHQDLYGETWYLWTDSDGTEHAFLPFVNEKGECVYYDEDGLQLELKVLSSVSDGMKYQIVDTHSNTVGFDASGYLVKEIDSFGNQRIYTRSSGKLTAVSLKPSGESAIEQVRFSYYTSGSTSVLKEIEYVGTARRIRLYYSTSGSGGSISQSSLGYLRRVEYCCTNGSGYLVDATVNYIYSSGLLSRASDALSDYYVSYAYSSGKVSTVSEYSESTLGQKAGFTYYGGKTVYRTSGQDDAYGNSDDILTHFIFDAPRRVITTYSTDVNSQTIYGAATSDYTELPTNTPTAEQAKQNNKLESSATVGATSVNLLQNGNFESDTVDGWTAKGTTKLSTLTNAKRTGRYGLRLAFTNDQTTAGTSQSVYLAAGTYTFSAYVRRLSTSEQTTAFTLDPPSGATVVSSSDTLTLTKPTASIAGFVPFSMTFTVSSSGTYSVGLTVTRTATGSTMIYYLDDIVLVRSESQGECSLIDNGGFENTNDTSWIDGYGVSIASTGHTGARSLALSSELTGDAIAMQEITILSAMEASEVQENPSYVPNIKPKSYILSGWGKANALKARDGRLFGVDVVIGYAIYGQSDIYYELYHMPFSSETSEWQYASMSIIPDYTIGYPAVIEIYPVFSHNNGTAYFDDLLLVENARTVDYTYDSEGRLIGTVSGNGYETQSITYYDEDDPHSVGEIDTITDHNGVKTVYRYYKHRVEGVYQESAEHDLINASYQSYDDYGNVVYLEEFSYGDRWAYTQYTYSTSEALFGRLLSVEDPTGLVTNYHYDTATRHLMAVTTSDGNGTAYTYDTLGRQTSARPATVSGTGYATESGSEQAVFAYSGNTLTSITTGSTTYGFTYDVYKNRQSVKVGSDDIAYYVYAAGNGKLLYTVYANGYTLKNVYDSLDRVSEIWYTTISGTIPTDAAAYDGYSYTRKEKFIYDEAGNVAAYIDYTDGTKTVYTYDIEGRPVQATRFDTTGGAVSVEFSDTVSYNSAGLLSQSVQGYLLNGEAYTNTESFAYDVYKRLKTHYYGLSGAENRTTYTYDDFNRLVVRYTEYDGLELTETYGYASGQNSIGESTIARVSSFETAVGGAETAYTYTYDARGNITHIYLGGVLKYSYAYDNLSQLVRENNAVANKTYVYTYDDAGNILTKKTYAYTTGTLGSVQSTQTYGYGNAAWGDQLTSYNGAALTYDEIGNPLTYNNGSAYSFRWSKGRDLAVVIKSGTTTFYYYNADGIRTRKDVGATKVEYTLNGSRIVAEKRGSMLLRYLYDAQGLPVGMILDGVTYLYEKNLQGDVVGIYTTGGAKVVTYAYDAWGKIISSSYASGYYSAYYYNPFRYRGYYYDTETGLYYLQSRYYDPTLGRFINADDFNIVLLSPEALTDKNLYAYCDNNPIMRSDDGGEFWHIVIGAVVGGAVEVVSQLIENQGDFSEINWLSVGIATAVGGLSAATGGMTGFSGKAVSAIISVGGDVIKATSEGTTDLKELGMVTLTGVACAGIGVGVDEAVKKIGGKIAVNHLAKKTPRQIKTIVNSLYKVSGSDRNKVKDIGYAVSVFRDLGEKYLGDAIPTAISSVVSGVLSIGGDWWI